MKIAFELLHCWQGDGAARGVIKVTGIKVTGDVAGDVAGNAAILLMESVQLGTPEGREAFIADVHTFLLEHGERVERSSLEQELQAIWQEAQQRLLHTPASNWPRMPETDDESFNRTTRSGTLRDATRDANDPDDLLDALGMLQELNGVTERIVDSVVRVEGFLRRPSGFEHVTIHLTPERSEASGVPLSNFIAQIVETIHDVSPISCRMRRFYVIEGSVAGKKLPRVRIPASRFARMGWIAEHWGPWAWAEPGARTRALLANAIFASSAGMRTRTVYHQTGWRRLDEIAGRWAYLHGGGALWSGGVVEDVRVELDGPLAGYRLPPLPENPELLAAGVRASWDAWGLVGPSVAAPLLGAAYGAPLAEWLDPGFTLWARGGTGTLKTSYCALVLSHFGTFSCTDVPANWRSSIGTLEREAFLIKDAMLLVDDFHRPDDAQDARRMRRKAARLIRAAGNRAGSAQAGEGGALEECWPRGIVVAIAEEGAPEGSTGARTWEIDFDAARVDPVALARAQERSARLAEGFSAYIVWLARRLGAGGDWLQSHYRAVLRRLGATDGHYRDARTCAYLRVSWEIFAQFALEVGAVTTAEMAERLRAVEAALEQVGRAQRTGSQ